MRRPRILEPARTAPVQPELTPQQGGAAALLRRAMRVLALWRRRIRTRAKLRNLSALDDHILQDIGMTRSQLICEASKPFWC